MTRSETRTVLFGARHAAIITALAAACTLGAADAAAQQPAEKAFSGVYAGVELAL